MRYSPNYPATVAEVLSPPVKFRKVVVLAVRAFADNRPWRGDIVERKAKFERLHADLCHIYGKATRLTYGTMDGGCSGTSHFTPASDTITLYGRLSVVTYLHEFAHALGRDERGAVRWSVSLFRRCFPRSFERCVTLGHTLRRD